MKIFLSWAGEESRQLAMIFESWLKKILQSSRPWMSMNITKGEGWDKEIHNGLQDTEIGLLFLTKDSIESKYLHYEAGAIANVPNALVCTFLYNIKNTDVKQPLSRFQSTLFEKDDILKLLVTINNKIQAMDGITLEPAQLSEMFDIMWPILTDAISKITSSTKSTSKEPIRSDRDLLEEMLNILRTRKQDNGDIDFEDANYVSRLGGNYPGRRIIRTPESEKKRVLYQMVADYLNKNKQSMQNALELSDNIRSKIYQSRPELNALSPHAIKEAIVSYYDVEDMINDAKSSQSNV